VGLPHRPLLPLHFQSHHDVSQWKVFPDSWNPDGLHRLVPCPVFATMCIVFIPSSFCSFTRLDVHSWACFTLDSPLPPPLFPRCVQCGGAVWLYGWPHNGSLHGALSCGDLLRDDDAHVDSNTPVRFTLASVHRAGDCNPGYFCPIGSSSATQSVCAAGQYSTGGAGTCTQCPAGAHLGPHIYAVYAIGFSLRSLPHTLSRERNSPFGVGVCVCV
jgi:hypothetical protein